MKTRKLLSLALALCLILSVCAVCASAEEKITLRYAYWGSSYENEAMLNIAAKYEEEHPNVEIECIYIPNADYTKNDVHDRGKR